MPIYTSPIEPVQKPKASDAIIKQLNTIEFMITKILEKQNAHEEALKVLLKAFLSTEETTTYNGPVPGSTI